MAFDQALGADALGCRCEGAGKKYVVDAESQDDIAHARLGKHVPVEAIEARGTEGASILLEDCAERSPCLARAAVVAQQAIADDALIEDAQFGPAAGLFL